MKRSPLELRMGSTGAGFFVGCGAGVGLVTRISLHAVPVLGQLAASLSASLGSLDVATGSIATAAQSHVRGLGVRNLDMGIGCGVMIGYGWGAGLMLSPTAQQSTVQGLQAVGRQLLAKLPQPLQAMLLHRQQHYGLAGAGEAHGSSLAWQDPSLVQQPLAGQHEGGVPVGPVEVLGLEGSSRSTLSSSPNAVQQQGSKQREERQQQQVAGEELVELTKLVVKQQNQLGDLALQVQALQAAVCKLDRSSPGCMIQS